MILPEDMRLNNAINEEQLRKALNILKPDGTLFEVRALKKSPKRTLSGYFRDVDTAVKEIMNADLRDMTVYFSLNELDPACYSRRQKDRMIIPENTTTDTDITLYNWLFVDLDPVRIAEVSSSDAELEKARNLGRKIYKYLESIGFEAPVIAMSGNGIHLLYRICLRNTPEHHELMKNCLNALSLMFSTDEVKVDTANFNQARICKLYGTLAQKGSGTEERPHRMSYIISAPAEIKQTKKAYLETLANMLPKQEKPQAYNKYMPERFDVRAWLQEHGLYGKEVNAGDYTKIILDECPFDPSHKAPDSMITIGSSGAIGFKCFHNSCQGKTWRDVRLKYEPDAYSGNADDSRIDAGWAQHQLHNRQKAINYAAEENLGPVFQTARQILDAPEESEDFIRSGIEGIDNRLRGLKKGFVTLLSGLRGGSKSTLLTEIALSAIDDGNNVIAYSGELTAKNFMRWMNLQAAGKNHTIQSQKWNNYYYVSEADQDKIAEWLGKHFLLYNNDYGNDYTAFRVSLEKQIEDQKTDLVILDNLMSLNIRGLASNDKYAAQTEFITDLQRLAKRTLTHIIFVAHPRKANGFLRLDDVSGTADLANLSDNAFIIHRNNNDFQRLTKDMFKWAEDNPVYSGTNVIEIAKDRDMGTQDVFIPLWYEPESKRLKNAPAEMIQYGWDTSDGFISADMDTIPF